MTLAAPVPAPGPEAPDAAAVVARLRATYGAGTTRPLAWRLAQLAGLRAMLAERGGELERALAADLGKPALEAHVTEVAFVAEEAARTQRHLHRWLRPRGARVPAALQPARASVVREPLGVVLVVAPWNYPVQLLLSPLLGALAAGNTVVAKPSELAPATSAVLARCLPRYLDPAAVAVVEGGPEVSTALLEQRFDHIFYTGGERVARVVAAAAARHLTPTTLELGGKCPGWVDDGLDDAALATVARRIAWGAFLNAGQTCVGLDYVLASERTTARLEPALAAAVTELFGPDPRSSPSYGRILSAAHVERLEGLMGSGRLVVGGATSREERYVAPTVLADVDPDSPVMREEVFGPVLPLVTVGGLDEAIDFVTARPKPLALYAFTDDRAARARLVEETSSGAVAFGAPVVHQAVHQLPFGGVGASGTGAYHGEHSVALFSHAKPVFTKPLGPDTLRLLYPPYTALKSRLVRRLLPR